MSTRLAEGLRVLVTASTRGIGRGVAEALLENGASVVINGRSRENMEEALGWSSERNMKGGYMEL